MLQTQEESLKAVLKEMWSFGRQDSLPWVEKGSGISIGCHYLMPFKVDGTFKNLLEVDNGLIACQAAFFQAGKFCFVGKAHWKRKKYNKRRKKVTAKTKPRLPIRMPSLSF